MTIYYNDFSSSISDFYTRNNVSLNNGKVYLYTGGRPYLYTKLQYKNVHVITSAATSGNGQVTLLGRYDGNISNSYDTPLNGIYITAWNTSENFVLRKNENGKETTLVTSSISCAADTFYTLDLQITGENSNLNCIAKVNGTTIYNGNFSYNPTNIINYVGVSGRETQTNAAYYDYIQIDDLGDYYGINKYNSYLI